MSSPINLICTLDVRDSMGNTPLHIAVQKGHRKIVQVLLCLGSDATLLNGNQQTVYDLAKDTGLHQMIHNCEKTISEAILRGEGRIHAAVHLEDAESLPLLAKIEGIYLKNKMGRTALHIAAGKKNILLLRKLIALGKDLEIRDHKGFTPLAVAALETKEVEVVRFFLEAGAKPNIEINGCSLLELVYDAGLIVIFQALYSFISKEESRELPTVLLAGSMKNLLKAVNSGAEINSGCLQLAIRARLLSLVAFLIDWFSLDVNQKMTNGRTPLEEATSDKILRFLLQRHAVPTVSVLKSIYKGNNGTLFQEALKNIQKKEGRNPLKTNFEVDRCLELLAEGWDLTLPLVDGQTFLHIAVLDKSIKALEFFIFIGVDPLKGDMKGQTPLSVAAAIGFEEGKKVLSKLGNNK